jgi:hypothetical protein
VAPKKAVNRFQRLSTTVGAISNTKTHFNLSLLVGVEETLKKKMAGVTRLELATSCVTGRRSNRLSYTPDKGQRNLPEVCCRSSELEKK